jgi:hypothetical protein
MLTPAFPSSRWQKPNTQSYSSHQPDLVEHWIDGLREAGLEIPARRKDDQKQGSSSLVAVAQPMRSDRDRTRNVDPLFLL